MENFYSRTERMLGKEGVERLKRARVAVFGAGGVGGFCIEALARAGVGTLDLIDSDTVAESNLNRQIIATRETIGEYKTTVMKNRILSINPEAKITTYNLFFDNNTSHLFDFSVYDYVVDAIDSVRGKIEIIKLSKAAGTRVISCMGAGNKLDPTMFEIADIEKTSVCPLARAVRTELKKLGIRGVKVLFSKEPPVLPKDSASDHAPGSISFVPSVAGLIIAGEVIKDIALR
ncbi:MAG: tRNA threonylcarbamoyladenosine dehydratase [Clostridia bacterium]|nr:tRNA threonylcarbamoyladenosine dehydratase [Clostridia bacterium]